MSKKLGKLLDQPERLVTKTIDKLEGLNGYPSQDARLLAENSQAVRVKIADLGLDPDDTTGEELYHALLVKFERDNALIDKALSLSSDSDLDRRLDKAFELVGQMDQKTKTWFLKHSIAKQLLRSQPPRRLMKQLNCRSIDSLLKRKDIGAIYLMLPYVESASWQKVLAKKIAKLRGVDYELRGAQLAKISGKDWSGLGASAPQAISNGLIGAVGLKPSDEIQKAGVLTLALLLLDGLEGLTHSEDIQSLSYLHPALVWWEQAKILMAVCGEDIVSLNLKDAAINYLSQKTYNRRLAQHGQRSLWNELTSRYENQTAQLEESLANLKSSAGEEFNKLTARKRPKNLAVEYAEAVANEF